MTFQSEPGFDLKFESLEFRRAGIELLSVKEAKRTKYASVFIPDGKLKYFIGKVEKYGSEETSKGEPKNRALIEGISKIRKATLAQLWADDEKLLPKSGETIWWEVWLRAGRGEDDILRFFRDNAHKTGLKTKNQDTIKFPDRTVLLVYGSKEQMARSLDLLNCIAELRKAKENPEFFMKMSVIEQREWVEEALERIEPARSDLVRLCILDTGVNRHHPLIQPHLFETDIHVYNPNWLKSDDMANTVAVKTGYCF